MAIEQEWFTWVLGTDILEWERARRAERWFRVPDGTSRTLADGSIEFLCYRETP